jgi:transcription elongation factor Elf1
MKLRYKHLFTCPNCDSVTSFVSSDAVGKGATYETSCMECNKITAHEYFKSRGIPE